jgi:hypothetical protein
MSDRLKRIRLVERILQASDQRVDPKSPSIIIRAGRYAPAGILSVRQLRELGD